MPDISGKKFIHSIPEIITMDIRLFQRLGLPESPQKLERFVNYEIAIRESYYDGKPSEFERMEFMDFSKARFGILAWSPVSRGNEFNNRTICDITDILQSNSPDTEHQKLEGRTALDSIPDYAVLLARYHLSHHTPQTPRVRNAPYTPKEREWVDSKGSYLYHLRRGLNQDELRLFLTVFRRNLDTANLGKMTPDFDIEEELARNDAKEVTEETLGSNLRYFVMKVLEGLNAPILTPEKRIGELFEKAIATRKVAVSDVPQGVYYGYPTMDFLRGLPKEYYGKRIALPTNYGFTVPFSLARTGQRIYIRNHVSNDEFIQRTGGELKPIT